MINIMVATPMYGGMCTSEYTQSLIFLNEAIIKSNQKISNVFLGNESLIQRARNNLANIFLNGDFTHLLFIDADVKFRTEDIKTMIQADKPIIVAPIPMKGINWNGVRKAVQDGKERISDDSGIFNITPLDGHIMESKNKPFQIKYGGTGMMLIQRKVFEELIPFTKSYNYKGNKTYDFFRVEIIQDDLLSEDYFFCDSYRKIGGTVWCAGWCETGHFGSYLFNGKYNQVNLLPRLVNDNITS